MFKKKSNIYNCLIIVAAFLIGILMYDKLPETIPIHWNFAGEVDGYGSKFIGLFVPPIIMIVLWFGMMYLPKIDPRKENYKKFDKSYGILQSVLLTFFFIIQVISILVSMGYDISINKIIPIVVGVLMIFIGNYMPKAKSNFFYGIKTPWTLSSEVSWKKTHRLGGKLFVISGLISILAHFIFSANIAGIVFFVCTLVAAIIPIVASYFYAKNN